MLRKTTDQCGEDWDLEIPYVQFHYMNHDHNATGYLPFYLSHGYFPRTPRLVLSPLPQSASKQSISGHPPLHRVLRKHTLEPSPVTCKQSKGELRNGNTYRIKHATNFRKRLLRHRDQLRVAHTRPVRLCPNDGGNRAGPPVVVPPTATSGHMEDTPTVGTAPWWKPCCPPVVLPPTATSGHMEDTPPLELRHGGSRAGQPVVVPPTATSGHMEDTPPLELRHGGSRAGQPVVVPPTATSGHMEDTPPMELRRGYRSRRPPQRYGNWELNPVVDYY
ncbi:hypothetical protein OS493_018392 [Desmophyllum pertusum]|uniref:Uncharacterized protein n=1 Tax=Desmophyllum pertusum TaxID=174260 RepID=A0A9X0DAX1_9CNID|nr:hypothetical protein OS493_018392 [Desmophyllum pertusum]